MYLTHYNQQVTALADRGFLSASSSRNTENGLALSAGSHLFGNMFWG